MAKLIGYESAFGRWKTRVRGLPEFAGPYLFTTTSGERPISGFMLPDPRTTATRLR